MGDHMISKMVDAVAYFRFAVVLCILTISCSVNLPLVVNTWPFTNATSAAWNVITQNNQTAVDAVEVGCTECEVQRCDGSVGWGSDPDEQGETTLDAMIMDGISHDVGGVGALRRIKSAISVARAVMERTEHTLLVGDQATDFAKEMGFQEEDLHSNKSRQMYKDWKQNNCQPNYRRNVLPDPKTSCGPYKPVQGDYNIHPVLAARDTTRDSDRGIGPHNHDTIGMIVIDTAGNIAGGTTTNGMNHKVPGRVGDSPIAGSGVYVDNDVGGAVATGDGDVMMRFLPSFYAVSLMRTGVSPIIAAREAIKSIVRYYPGFSGALLASNIHGEHGAACHGFAIFPYSVRSPEFPDGTVINVTCMN